MTIPLYKVASLPAKWPAKPTTNRKAGNFGENWSATMDLLARELRMLNAREVVLQMDVRMEDLRRDGMVSASARPGPSVILVFTSGANRLTFPCDRFNWWQTNVRAIALALEALRKVDRYGVQAGRQYEGFKALGSGSANGQPAAMTLEEAAKILAKHSDLPASVIEHDAQTMKVAARLARANAHPDRGGDTADFQRIDAAVKLLEASHP